MEALIQDLKYAARRLAGSPLFTTMAVVIIALGIGANTAIFSGVNAALFRPQPFENPDELVHIYQDSDDGEPNSTSYAGYRDITGYRDLFSDVAATFDFVGEGYFETLRIPILHGRSFAGDDGADSPPVVIVNENARRTLRGIDRRRRPAAPSPVRGGLLDGGRWSCRRHQSP